MNRSVVGLIVCGALLTSCDELVSQLPEAEFNSQAIQLLPTGFPVYPKAFSSESVSDLVATQLSDVTFRNAINQAGGGICIDVGLTEVCLTDLLNTVPGARNSIDSAISELDVVQGWVDDQLARSLSIYNSSPLGVGVGEQLGRTIASVVEFTGVELTVCVRNRTDAVWGVPIRFSLFMGDSQSVVDRTALVMAADAPKDQDYTFVLQPGETQEITLDAPSLVSALNNFRSLSLDYDAVVEVADLQPDTFLGWVNADRADNDGNGVADSLASWGLIFEELSIKVNGRGDIDVPDNFPQWMQDLVNEDEPATP
ncbi:MAG: hypothetical protein AAGA48_28115 [Myxococcota bacterium]